MNLKSYIKKIRNEVPSKEDSVDLLFQPYIFFINSKQAKLIINLWNEKIIKRREIAEILLSLEINDFAAKKAEKEWN